MQMLNFKKNEIIIQKVLNGDFEPGESNEMEVTFLDESDELILIFNPSECMIDNYADMIKDIDISKAITGNYQDTEDFDINCGLILLDKVDDKIFTCLNYEIELRAK